MTFSLNKKPLQQLRKKLVVFTWWDNDCGGLYYGLMGKLFLHSKQLIDP